LPGIPCMDQTKLQYDVPSVSYTTACLKRNDRVHVNTADILPGIPEMHGLVVSQLATDTLPCDLNAAFLGYI
jgi:hypothetical protein